MVMPDQIQATFAGQNVGANYDFTYWKARDLWMAEHGGSDAGFYALSGPETLAYVQQARNRMGGNNNEGSWATLVQQAKAAYQPPAPPPAPATPAPAPVTPPPAAPPPAATPPPPPAPTYQPTQITPWSPGPINATENGVQYDSQGIAFWGLDVGGGYVRNVPEGRLVKIGGPNGTINIVGPGGKLTPYTPTGAGMGQVTNPGLNPTPAPNPQVNPQAVIPGPSDTFGPASEAEGGMYPEGYGLEWWKLNMEYAQLAANAAIAQAEATGYFNGMSTLARQQAEAQIALQASQAETARRLADSQIRAADEKMALDRARLAVDVQQNDRAYELAQRELDEARRSGDLDRQQRAQQELSRLNEEMRQFDVEQQRLNATLEEQRRQFNATATGYVNGTPTVERAQLDEAIRQNDRAYALAQREMDEARRAGDLNRQQQAQIEMNRLDEERRQFNAQIDQQERQLNEQIRQNTLNYQTAQRQLDEARRAGDLDRQQAALIELNRLTEQRRQFDQQLGYQYSELSEQIRQNTLDYETAQRALDEARRTGDLQRAQEMQIEVNRLGEQARQFNAQLAEQTRQNTLNYQTAQRQLDEARRAGDLDRQQQALLEMNRLTEERRQYDLTLAEQSRKNDLDYQIAQRQLDEARRAGDLQRAQELQIEVNRLGEERRQFDQQYSLSQQQLVEQIRQNTLNYQTAQRELDEARRAGDLQRAQEWQIELNRLSEERRQFDQEFAHSQQQLAELIRNNTLNYQTAQRQLDEARRTGDLDRQQQAAQEMARLTEDRRQYDQTYALQREQAEASIRQRDVELQRLEAERQDAIRTGDLNRAQELEVLTRTQALEREQLAQQAYQFAVSTTGYVAGPDGQQVKSLDRERWEAEQQQLAWERAANPARAFENEIARGVNAPVGAGASPLGSFVQSTASGQGQGATGAGTGAGAGAGTEAAVRVPAFINAFRQGQAAPTAGTVQAPSTESAASTAALTERDFRLAPKATYNSLKPTQQMMLQSYGRAGGVSNDDQDFWKNAGAPRQGSVQASYQLV